MASAFAMMAKRRYQAILARQAEKSARQRKRVGLHKPPTSSDQTTVWYWELDGIKMTLMFDIEKREVWCNGLVLRTETLMPENSIEQCSLAFTIDTSPECSCCGMQHKTSEHKHEQFSTEDTNVKSDNTQPKDSEPCTKDSKMDTHKTDITTSNTQNVNCNKSSDHKQKTDSPPHVKNDESCDCLNCKTGKHQCLIKFIKVAVDQTVHELYIDGCMIQENTQNPYNYDLWKPQNEKKND